MLWFSGSLVTINALEAKVAEATSESIPNGEIDLNIAFEITDVIRSKKLPPKQCMRALKKRLTLIHNNPNLVKLTLQLSDLCVKNCGFHFLLEIALNEFVDYLVNTLFKINYDTKNRFVSENEATFQVGQYILQLLQEWAVYFQGQLQLNNVEKAVNGLKHDGYQLPPLSNLISSFNGNNSAVVDLEVPPDWVDSDECMICYNKFSMLNRKHHCRSCGGVYCGEHSSHNLPLVHLGIMEPVRVCDNCWEKVKRRNNEDSSHQRLRSLNASSNHRHTSSSASNTNPREEEDEDLKRAIELSLKETQIQLTAPTGPPPNVNSQVSSSANNEEEEDEEMKAAIAASLQEYEAKGKLYEQQLQPPEEDFYGSILPTGGPVQTNPFNSYQPQQNPQNPQPQPQPQQQHQQQHQQHFEEDLNLSPKEEESINLFITLLNNLKNDPQKRSTILYDSKLAELHAQILQLKPKLNRSLRAAIERYDSFLELNNKLLTITRLYDSYLDSKLQEAYRKHSIGSIHHQAQAPQTPQEQQYNFVQQGPPANSQQNQFTGYPSENSTSFYGQPNNLPYPDGSKISQQSQEFQKSQYAYDQDKISAPEQFVDGSVDSYNNEQSSYKRSQQELPYESKPSYPTYGSSPSETRYPQYGAPSEPEAVASEENYNDSDKKFSYPLENISQSDRSSETRLNATSEITTTGQPTGPVLPYPKNNDYAPYLTTFPSEPETSNVAVNDATSEQRLVHSEAKSIQSTEPEEENEDKVAEKFPPIDQVANLPDAPTTIVKTELRYTEEPLIEL